MNLRDGNSTSSEILLSRLLGYSYISGSREGCARTHLFLYRSRSPAPRSWETLGRCRRAEEETPVVTPIWTVSPPRSHCRPATSSQSRPFPEQPFRLGEEVASIENAGQLVARGQAVELANRGLEPSLPLHQPLGHRELLQKLSLDDGAADGVVEPGAQCIDARVDS